MMNFTILLIDIHHDNNDLVLLHPYSIVVLLVVLLSLIYISNISYVRGRVLLFVTCSAMDLDRLSTFIDAVKQKLLVAGTLYDLIPLVQHAYQDESRV